MISFNTSEKDDVNVLVQVSLSKAYRIMKEKGNTNPYDLFLPLDSIGEIAAQTLFLNRYEINIIMKSYLDLWYCEQSKMSIPLYNLSLKFEDRFLPIVSIFFQNSDVTYDLYFQFICIFVFLDLSKVISLLLRMDKIFSHLFISRQQLNHFFQTYHLSSGDYNDIITEITEPNLNAPEDSFSIKKFISYFEKQRKFIEFIADFRKNCIKVGLNYDLYRTIKCKIEYYYNEKNILKKEESCIDKMMRTLFSNQPEPYRFDYSTIDPSEASFSGFIRVVVKRFGAEVDRRASSVSTRSISRNSMKRASNGGDINKRTINRSIRVAGNAICSINLPGATVPISPLPLGNSTVTNSPVHQYKATDYKGSIKKYEVAL